MRVSSGWIGVDLDGTLAFYDGWKRSDHIGDPIPKMAERVRSWLTEGREVRIVTARANRNTTDKVAWAKFILAFSTWCETHFGTILDVTAEKDYEMESLWDDRAVQVIPNTGERADGL